MPAATVISSGAACRYGADGNRSHDALSREISHRNAARTIKRAEISPLRFASVEMTEGAGRLFYNLRPKGATITLGLKGRQT